MMGQVKKFTNGYQLRLPAVDKYLRGFSKTSFLLDKDTYFVRDSPKGLTTSAYYFTSLLHKISWLFMYFYGNRRLLYVTQELLILIEHSLKLLGENLESFSECQRKNRHNFASSFPRCSMRSLNCSKAAASYDILTNPPIEKSKKRVGETDVDGKASAELVVKAEVTNTRVDVDGETVEGLTTVAGIVVR
ncbi:hypothetical protein NL676_008936 [Syzygium grande]|nr:hypothetical protein NL676_008936 [Syzygium grande]